MATRRRRPLPAMWQPEALGEAHAALQEMSEMATQHRPEDLARTCLEQCDASQALEEMTSQHHSERLAKACVERWQASETASAPGVCV